MLKMKCLWKQSENEKKKNQKKSTTSKKHTRRPNLLWINVFMYHKYTKKSKRLKMLMILDKLPF